MGRADYLALGDANGICDRCGFKYKMSELRRTWDKLMVCKWDWDPRHPQDFVQARRDKQIVPYARPEPEDVFLTATEVTKDDL